MAKSNLDLKKIANVLKKFQNELTPSKQEMKDLSLVPGTEYHNVIEFVMEGHFTKDRDGNFGFSGKIDAVPENIATTVEAEAGLELGFQQKLTGDGNLKIHWKGEVRVKVPNEVE